MRDGENISQVAALGVDWIGMVFYAQSPRNVTMIPTNAGIIPDRANAQCTLSDVQYKRVGVFVDEMAQNIVTRVVNFRLDAVQLHGNESPTLIRNLRATLTTSPTPAGADASVCPPIAPGLQIWKAISIGTADDLALCKKYEDCVDMFVFDTKTPDHGGSGHHFDWSILDAYDGPLPFLLSGGIAPDDAAAIKAFRHPRFVGIDINSRFETAPAMKDVGLIEDFIARLQ